MWVTTLWQWRRHGGLLLVVNMSKHAQTGLGASESTTGWVVRVGTGWKPGRAYEWREQKKTMQHRPVQGEGGVVTLLLEHKELREDGNCLEIDREGLIGKKMQGSGGSPKDGTARIIGNNKVNLRAV